MKHTKYHLHNGITAHLSVSDTVSGGSLWKGDTLIAEASVRRSPRDEHAEPLAEAAVLARLLMQTFYGRKSFFHNIAILPVYIQGLVLHACADELRRSVDRLAKK